MDRRYDDTLIVTDASQQTVTRLCSKGHRWRWARVRPAYGSEIIVRGNGAGLAAVLRTLAAAGIAVQEMVEGDFGGLAETDIFVGRDGNAHFITMQR